MTLPNLIADHKVKSTVARLKKVHSLLAQAYISAKQEYGEFVDWYDVPPNTFLFYQYDYNVQGLEIFAKQMKTVKLCTDGKSCNQAGNTLNLNKTTNFFLNSPYASMILSDGTIIYFANYNNGCGNTDSDNCGYFYADINGKTRPNTIGKDVFCFRLAKHKVIPCGIQGNLTDPFKLADDIYGKGNACDLTSGGGGCTAWVLQNENMDYLKCVDKLSWDGAKSCKEAE